MSNYDMEIVPRCFGDMCLKIKIGDYEVSVAFDSEYPDNRRGPSNVAIFKLPDRKNITSEMYEEDYAVCQDFKDLMRVIKLVQERIEKKGDDSN